MARSPDEAPRPSEFCDHFDDEGDGSLWTTILSEVQSSANNKLPSYKNLIVLGDNLSGKTTLVAKLQGNEDPEKGSGLEYFYIDVKDEYREDQARLGVWVSDGDPTHAGLLKYALTPDSFEHSLAVIVVSMAQPWAIVKAINSWCSILADHVDRLGISADRMKEYQSGLVQHFQEYAEPDGELFSSTQSLLRKSTNPLHPNLGSSQLQQSSDNRMLLPLPDGVLTNNLGIPLVFVVTKSDEITQLEKEYDYREEHFDFVQQHVRKIALQYGAALFYVSVKADKNCDLLYRYIVHRIYGLSFSNPASVVDRDAVFIPAGWDSEKKIAILYDNMVGMRPDDAFEDVIHKPSARRAVQREVEIVAEDDQEFLGRQQAVLVKNAQSLPADGPTSRPELSPVARASGPAVVNKTTVIATAAAASTARASTSPVPTAATTSPAAAAAALLPGASVTSPRKPDLSAKPGGAGETVLANFFNSLLSKKTGSVTPTKPGADAKAAKTSIADELDRMSGRTAPSDLPPST